MLVLEYRLVSKLRCGLLCFVVVALLGGQIHTRQAATILHGVQPEGGHRVLYLLTGPKSNQSHTVLLYKLIVEAIYKLAPVMESGEPYPRRALLPCTHENALFGMGSRWMAQG